MADSRLKLTLSAAARARKRHASTRDSWLDSDDCHAKWRAKRAEAQASANALGMDHGMQVNTLLKEWTYFLLPAKQYRQGHETQCEVVHPENLARTQRGHGPLATRPPSVVGPDYHGGPWVGRGRALELRSAWWAQWDSETRRLRWLDVCRTVKALNVVLRVALALRQRRTGEGV